jgi:hypothetical protein
MEQTTNHGENKKSFQDASSEWNEYWFGWSFQIKKVLWGWQYKFYSYWEKILIGKMEI